MAKTNPHAKYMGSMENDGKPVYSMPKGMTLPSYMTKDMRKTPTSKNNFKKANKMNGQTKVKQKFSSFQGKKSRSPKTMKAISNAATKLLGGRPNY